MVAIRQEDQVIKDISTLIPIHPTIPPHFKNLPHLGGVCPYTHLLTINQEGGN